MFSTVPVSREDTLQFAQDLQHYSREQQRLQTQPQVVVESTSSSGRSIASSRMSFSSSISLLKERVRPSSLSSRKQRPSKESVQKVKQVHRAQISILG